MTTILATLTFKKMFDLVVFVNIPDWRILIFDEFKNLLCKGKGDCDTQGMFFLFEKVLCKGTEGRDSLVFSPKRQEDVQEWEARNVNWRKWPINSSRILFSFSGPSVFRFPWENCPFIFKNPWNSSYQVTSYIRIIGDILKSKTKPAFWHSKKVDQIP